VRRNLEVEVLLVKAVATATTITPGDHRKGTRNRVHVPGLVDGVIGERRVGGVNLRVVSNRNQINKRLDERQTAGYGPVPEPCCLETRPDGRA
jgi:hypothetical protein